MEDPTQPKWEKAFYVMLAILAFAFAVELVAHYFPEA